MNNSQEWFDEQTNNYADGADYQGEYDQSAEYYDAHNYDEYDDYGEYDDPSLGDYATDYAGSYYNERQLDRILDELSDLKRGYNAVSRQNQVNFAPDGVAWPPHLSPPLRGGVAPYNHYSLYGNNMSQDNPDSELKRELVGLKEQLGRMRDDIGIAKSDQKMQLEIMKLKEDMAKERIADQRDRENRREMLAEMAKLNASAELEKVKSNFELEKIKASAELEKIKSNAELEKIRLKAELEKTRSESEHNKLNYSLDSNGRADLDRTHKADIDKLEQQVQNLKENNAQNAFRTELASLNSQLASMQDEHSHHHHNGGEFGQALQVISAQLQSLVAQRNEGNLPNNVVVTQDNSLREEVAKLSQQISKINQKTDRADSDKYFDSQFDKLNRQVNDISQADAQKDARDFQAQVNNALLQELQKLGAKIEALPKNEFSPQGDEFYHPEVGGVHAAKTFGGKPVACNCDQDCLEDDKQDIILDRLEDIASSLEELQFGDMSDGVQDDVQQVLAELSQLTDSISSKLTSGIDKVVVDIAKLHDTVQNITKNDYHNQNEMVVVANKLGSLQSQLQQLSDNGEHSRDFVEDRLQQLLSKTDWADSNNSQLVADVAYIRTRLTELFAILNTSDSNANTNQSIQTELGLVRQSLDSLINNGQNSVQDDLQFIRKSLESDISKDNQQSLSQFDEFASELVALKEEIKNARLLDQTEVVEELEELKNELRDFKLNSGVGEFGSVMEQADVTDLSLAIKDLKDQLTQDRLDSKLSFGAIDTNSLADGSIADDIASLKDEVRSLVAQINTTTISREHDDAVDSLLLEELVRLREDKGNNNNIKEELDNLKDFLQQIKSSDKVDSALDMVALHNDIVSLRSFSEENNNTLHDKLYSLYQLIAQAKTDNSDDKFEQIRTDIGNIASSINQSSLSELAGLKDQVQALHLDVVADKTTDKDAQQAEILDAINAMRIQIGRLKVAGDGMAEYEDAVDSILLQELVSLRNTLSAMSEDKSSDKYQDLKDKLSSIDQTNSVAYQDIKEQLNELKGGNNTAYKELKEQLTDINENNGADYIDIQEELKGLKNELASLRQRGDINQAIDLMSLQNDINELKNWNDINSSQVRDKQTVMLEQLAVITSKLDSTSSSQLVDLKAQLQAMHSELASADAITQQEQAAILQALVSMSEQLDSQDSVMADSAASNSTDAIDALLLEELVSLRQAVDTLKTGGADSSVSHQLLDNIKQELAILTTNNASNVDGLIKQELEALRQEISLLSTMNGGEHAVSASLLQQELDKLRGDLLEQISSNIQSANSDSSQESIADIKKSVVQLRDTVAKMVASSDYINDFAEQFELLQKELSEVRQAKEEPDYGVLNEVMAVRNEFQAVKTELGKLADNALDKTTLESDTQSVLAEVRDIKDQLFAASMANIGDDDTDEFENYNKIIISELASLRDQIESINEAQTKQGEITMESLIKELEDLKGSLDNLKAE